MVNKKLYALNIGMQTARLKNVFPTSKVVYFTSSYFVWKGSIKPSPLSNSYDIRLEYKKGMHPNIYVINTTLTLYPGETELPHIYNTKNQWLCLYYRKDREWKSSMYIADTIIPWASEWLFYYEIWLSTGKWRGEGIHHSSIAAKPVLQEKDKNINSTK
jgi:hypothetical protein